MYFLNGAFVDAEKVFAESKHDFPANEINEVQFKPAVPGRPLERVIIVGKVVQAQYGRSII